MAAPKRFEHAVLAHVQPRFSPGPALPEILRKIAHALKKQFAHFTGGRPPEFRISKVPLTPRGENT